MAVGVFTAITAVLLLFGHVLFYLFANTPALLVFHRGKWCEKAVEEARAHERVTREGIRQAADALLQLGQMRTSTKYAV